MLLLLRSGLLSARVVLGLLLASSMAAGMRRFAKRTDSIPTLDLGNSVEKQNSIILMERGLVGNFLGTWPNPKIVLKWVSKNLNEQVPSIFFVIKVFLFLFLKVWKVEI
jgi:hypothetical protein